MDIVHRRNYRTPCNHHRNNVVAEVDCTFRNPVALLSPNCCYKNDDVVVDVVGAAAAAVVVDGVACTVVVVVVAVVVVVESGACNWLNKGWRRNQADGTSPTVIPRSQ